MDFVDIIKWYYFYPLETNYCIFSYIVKKNFYLYLRYLMDNTDNLVTDNKEGVDDKVNDKDEGENTPTEKEEENDKEKEDQEQALKERIENSDDGDGKKSEDGTSTSEEKERHFGIRKKLRRYLVKKTVETVSNSSMPPDLACLMLKIMHFRLPFDLMLYASIGSGFLGLCLWVFVMSVFCFFLLLDGCVLSVIEYKLTGNSLNVMDIFLWLSGAEFNYTNRYNATLIAAIIYLLSFFLIVFRRGGFSGSNINRLVYYLTLSFIPEYFSNLFAKFLY